MLDAAFTVLATGAHDGPALFEGNDLPGVYSLRAARKLVSAGVAPGARIVIVVHEDTPASSYALAQALVADLTAAKVACTLHVGRVVKAHGSSSVRKVTLARAGVEETHPADALVVEARRSPSFELATQSGATVARTASGFAVTSHVWAERYAALGEVTGAEPSVRAFEAAARDLAARLPVVVPKR